MSHSKLILVPALLCATAVFGQRASKSAHADIVNAQGQIIGTAKLLAAKHRVRIEFDISQLPPGVHGVHVHNVGKCEGPDFTSAGPHLNPYAKKHGRDNPEGPHAGDLLNIEVKADGTAKATLRDTMVTLADGPKFSLSRWRNRDHNPRERRRLQNRSGGELRSANRLWRHSEISGSVSRIRRTSLSDTLPNIARC